MFKRVLVTGGAGFVGSHLVDVLVSRGFDVVVFDNLSTGRVGNIRRHLKNVHFSFVEGDLRSESVVDEVVRGVDVVFHLAAITSVPFSVRFPKVTWEVNVEGTRKLLEACLRHEVERFVFASSCAVYGRPEYLPIDEGHPVKPLSPYGESKVEAEKLCMDFYEKHGLETVILRLFNVYGLRMRKDRYGGVVARFVESLKAGKPPVVYGDGEQTRDFIHVDDVVGAMLLALECGNAVGEVFNIATGVPTSINMLAYMVAKILGKVDVKPQHRKERVGDIKHSYANIQKAKTCLGFTPRITLEEGLSTLCTLNGKKNTKS